MKGKDFVSIAAILLCVAAAAGLPGIGFLFTMLGAVICGLLYVRRGWYPVIGGVALGAVCAYAVTQSLPAAILAAVGVGVPGCAMMMAWRKKQGMREIVTAGTVGFLVQTMLDFGITRVITGKNVFAAMMEALRENVNAMLPQMREMLELSGAENTEESMRVLTEAYQVLTDTVEQMIPALLFLLCAGMAYIVLCGCAAVLRRRGEKTERISPFTQLHASRSMVGAVLVMLVIGMFVSQPVICGAALNIMTVLFAYFIVCGISLFCFFLKRWIPRVWIRALAAVPIVAVLCFMMLMPICNPMYLFMLLGVLDSAFHFRTRVGRNEVC